MKQIEWKKRLISMFLAMLMLVSSVFGTGISVRAAETDIDQESENDVDDTGENSEENPEENPEENSGENPEDNENNNESEEDTQISVEDIRLSKTSLNMETGDTAMLYLTIYPEDAEYGEILWESDTPEVATVTAAGTSAMVTASSENEGMAVIRVTVGAITAVCDVLVTQKAPLLESLKFTSSTSPDNAYELSDMEKAKKTFDLIVPVDRSTVYIWPDLDDDVTDAVITASYTDYTGELTEKNVNTTGTYTGLSFLLQSGSLTKTQILLTVTSGDREEVYTIDVYRGTGMSEITFRAENGAVLEYSPAFAFDTKYYDLYVPSNAQTVNISMVPADETCSTFYVNGQETVQEYMLESVHDYSKITIGCTAGEETKAIEYTFRVKYVPVCNVTFVKTPEDMLVSVYDAAGNRISADTDDSYLLIQGDSYTYIASRNGYITTKDSFTVSEDMELQITLETIHGSGNAVHLDAEWGGVYKLDTNQNIISATLPNGIDNAAIDWENAYGSLSGICLVDDMIYCYSKTNLMMLDKETGEIVKEISISGTGQTEHGNKPVYGDGKIFIPMTNGSMQAFDAFTLESLWIYHNLEGGIMTGGVKYDSGYVYAGLYNSSTETGQLICLSAEDENPSESLEKKAYIWKHTAEKGYYKTCTYVTNGMLYAVSYGGQLFCIEQQTGLVRQTVNLGTMGGTSAGIAYYEGRIYFSTVNGYVCSYLLTENGVDTGSLQSIQPGGFSESTPVIYNNRMYVGYSLAATSGQPHGVAPYYMGVVTIDPETGAMKLAYQVSLTNQLNESVTLNVTGEDQSVEIYLTENNGNYAKVYVIKDAPGQTEASVENEYLKLTASSSEYAAGAVTASESGAVYVRTTSGKLYSVSRSEFLINGISVSDEKAVIDQGSFNSYVMEHEIMVSTGVTSTILTVFAADGIRIMIDGVEGSSREIQLTDGKAETEVTISNGIAEKTYQFDFYEISNNTNLAKLFLSNGTNFTMGSVTTYYPAEELSEEQDSYTLNYYSKPSPCLLWLRAEEGGSDAVKVKTISGFTNNKKTLHATAFTGGAFYYRLDIDRYETAVLEVTVTAPDGITKKVYTITIERDTEKPVISNGQILTDTRTANSVDLSFTASEQGTLYYLLYDKMQSTMPTTATYGTSGILCETNVEEGVNTITIRGLPKENQYLYAIMQDSAGNYSMYNSPVKGEIGESPVIPMEDLILDRNELYLEKGEKETLTASLIPEGTSDDPTITWVSNNPYVATVSFSKNTAVITAVGGGTATITVRAAVNGNTYTTQCKVTVPVTVNTIVFSSERLELYEGESGELSISLLPSELEVTPKVIWRNSNNTVISMNVDGNTAVIEGLSKGTATIEVIAGTVSSKCVVTVKSHAVTGDMNQDGIINVMDIAMVVDMIDSTDAADLEMADLNRDGAINVMDIAVIVDLMPNI